jgi:hypothetical protein
MASATDRAIGYPRIAVVAETFVLLAAAAWFASSPGVAVALACYGALLVSERLCALCRSTATRARGLLGLALTWLVVLAFCALVLPSNFSAALI